MFKIIDGKVSPARWCGSPNFEPRPAGVEIDLLVLHCIALPPGQYGACDSSGQSYIDALFTNQLDCNAHDYFANLQGLKVSSHLLLDRSGQLVQYVDLAKRAWHAGQSCYKGRENCNDYSIGIELEGSDDQAYTEAQYTTLIPLIQAVMECYPAIVPSRIVGHEHIAPGRKTDPGPFFDWSRVFAALD